MSDPKPIKTALVVCGPTASGKSELSDNLSERLTDTRNHHVPTLVVDSMQVYKEIPVITNQARRRRAELAGIVSVTEEWSVARHRERAEEILTREDTFVLDAGTGMYLNALLLDFPLAPRVSPELRLRAQEASKDDPNPRRASRERELELAGGATRGSVWEGSLRHETTIFYIRPERREIDAAIARRSKKIVDEGLEEAATLGQMLADGAEISPSVMDSVGVRELIQYLSGTLSLEQAEEQITIRTRRLARRQLRWFDKLARTLEGRARVFMVHDSHQAITLHSMHDIIGS